ncbi:MAG: NADH-quinone oxidoreductase subunit NuoG [Actinobacteria bacterium]|nr:NADH-quinone oxidoreductase subunit NuoG [Actinomycetota bacterium]
MTQQQTEMVTVTINGQQVQAENGRLLIDVAEEMGIFVPRFCYHPGMKSVAVCRMCLVKVEGMPKLVPSCSTPVADGMVVETDTPEPAGAQEDMLEFLLINHPLDCPICDRGGECPLQDQTYAHGPGSSRFVEPKRTYEKALDISQLVVLDRERCVLCWRCVRFSDEVAGDRFIQLVDRGSGTQILTFSDEPFDSYFSGNTIQICPVGALTASTYRFVSRPWDLKAAPSVCSYCSVGCPTTNESRGDKLVRVQALPNENVNDFWICDKGRFGFHYVDAKDRLSTPLVRDGDDFRSATWGEAVAAAAEKLGGGKVGVIAGGHLTTEDAFAIQRLARKTIKTPHLDARIQDDGAAYERTLAYSGVVGSTATINDLDGARSIVWVGPDPKEVLPVLYLRLRKAVLDGGAKLIVVSPRRLSLDAFATHVIRCEPGGEANALSALTTTAPVKDDLAAPLVACWSPANPGRETGADLDSLLKVAVEKDARWLVCAPHAGSQGMLDMGVHPALESGYRPIDEPGMDTRAMLEAAAAGELDALIVVGADPISDFPNRNLAQAAMEKVGFSLVIELFPTETARLADVVLPSTAAPEIEGTLTNLERRLQKLEPLTKSPGTAREPWRAMADLARAMDDDWKWTSFADVWAAITKEVPTHQDLDVAALAQEVPPSALQYESGTEEQPGPRGPVVAGPGGQYPKGHRSGAPFKTASWPLSWELRQFEAKQRPGHIPDAPEAPEEKVGAGADAAAPMSGEGFVVYAGRQIYDEGAMVSRSSVLHALSKGAFVELNDEDAKELDVTDGDEVTLTAGNNEMTATVVIADISKGAVFVPYDQKGLRANELLGAGGRVKVAKA